MTNVRSLSAQLGLPAIEHPLRRAKISPERLPTNTTTRLHAVHRWFNFVAGFAPEFVAQHCPSMQGGILLDPFAGCGTSLVVAQSLGHRAVGFEPHPFFVRIARAKTHKPPGEADLASIEEILLNAVATSGAVPHLSESAAAFLEKLFIAETLEQLLRARSALEGSRFKENDLAFLLLSRVVEMCSKAKTDGIYKAPTSRKTPATPVAAIVRTVQEIRQDLRESSFAGDLPPVEVHCASAEDMSGITQASVDLVFTSPPYLNNFDFAEMTRMHLYFWGICGSWGEITDKVRSRLVVNTTTALSGHRDIQSNYRDKTPAKLRPELDGIASALREQRKVRAGNKEYDLLIYPYFAQMHRILEEAQRCLKVGSAIHVIVSDAAFYGVHVSTPQFLAIGMAEMGFQTVECRKLRDRGHRWLLNKRDGSPTGLGEYHVIATRGAA